MSRVAEAALAAVGTRFRLHGRGMDGLDCVGLVALALRAGGYSGEVPSGYSLRGGDLGVLDRVLVRVASAAPGDVLLMAAGLGREVRVMASGVGDATPVETRCVMRGASVVPPSPVHLRCFAEADGSATVKWTRRSRAGWRWIDGVDAPLSEEVEAYRVTVTAGGTSREVDVPAPFVAVTAAERAASASVAVRQRGIFGESLAVDLIVPA